MSLDFGLLKQPYARDDRLLRVDGFCDALPG
jgi:hypothetical protein